MAPDERDFRMVEPYPPLLPLDTIEAFTKAMNALEIRWTFKAQGRIVSADTHECPIDRVARAYGFSGPGMQYLIAAKLLGIPSHLCSLIMLAGDNNTYGREDINAIRDELLLAANIPLPLPFSSKSWDERIAELKRLNGPKPEKE